MERFTVYAETPDATHREECPQIRVMAHAHRQHVWTHTTLVGVTKAGAERLADFVALHEAHGSIRLAVPHGPILTGWTEESEND